MRSNVIGAFISLFVSAGSIAVAADPPRADIGTTDLYQVVNAVPAESEWAFSTPNIGQLVDRFERLFQQAGHGNQGLQVRPLLSMLPQSLGLKMEDIRKDGALTIFALDGRVSDTGIVLSIVDRDEVAKRLGAEGVKDNVATKLAKRRGVDLHWALRGKLLLMAKRDALQAMLKRPSLAQETSKTVIQKWQRADLIAHSKLPENSRNWRNKTLNAALNSPDPIQKRAAQDFVTLLSHGQRATLSVSLEKGVGLQLSTAFGNGAEPLLKSMEISKSPATRWLPAENLYAAVGYQSDQNGLGGGAELEAARAKLLLQQLVSQRRHVAPVIPSMIELFGEGWVMQQSVRTGLYASSEPNLGFGSLLTVIETKDADDFFQNLTELAALVHLGSPDGKPEQSAADMAQWVKQLGADKYRDRQAAYVRLQLLGEQAREALKQARESDDPEVRYRVAQLLGSLDAVAVVRQQEDFQEDVLSRMKGKFEYYREAEKHGKLTTDILRFRFDEASEKDTAMVRGYFGPQWDRVRLTRVKNNVVVMVGSDLARYKELLRNVQQDLPGLAEPQATTRPFFDPGKSRMVWHFSMERVRQAIIRVNPALAKQMKRANPPEKPLLSSVWISVDAKQRQLSLTTQVPVDEIRSIGVFGWVFGL